MTFLSVLGAFALMPATTASAHDYRHDGRLVGYTPCGKPIFAYHEVVGHDRCGRNVWEWVTHYPSGCHCRSSHREDSCERDHHHRDSGWSHRYR